MALSTKLVALVGSAAIAASAAAYYAIGPGGGRESEAEGDAGEQSQSADGEVALRPCIGPDQVFYASRQDGLCLPGHRRYELEEDEDDTCDLCDPFEDEDEDKKKHKQRMRSMHRDFWAVLRWQRRCVCHRPSSTSLTLAVA